MPRENRKRGKKHKKKAEEDVNTHHEEYPSQHEDQAAEAGPSWIVSASDPAIDQNAPFGFVDAEVKAYFRTVDVQIREWQETKPEVDVDEDVDPNEDRRLFFVAALQEMSGKEKQLATDPDCSTILERMIHSMDDFVRRVFMDRLTGSLEQLSKHRFASHVCQTLFTAAADTIARESRGIFPPTPESQREEGELRTFTRLALDACEELVPSLSSLIMDPFASHVVRALLILLAPTAFDAGEDHVGAAKSEFAVRSKKSAAYKARQGSMKSVFAQEEEQSKVKTTKRAPKEFKKAALTFVDALREQLGENEVRSLAANQVASPVLQMLLELEAAFDQADSPGSLMDRVLVGLITAIHENADVEVPESDYLMTLLRDPTASHLLETLVRQSPDRVFSILWQTYFTGKLPRLAVHPVANFVVAKAVERLNAEQLATTVQELQSVAVKIIKNSRIGVFQALLHRASTLQAEAHNINNLILSAFELDEEQEKSLIIPCILRLKSPQDYRHAITSSSKAKEEEPAGELRHKRRKTEDPLEPKTQGALLLQAMLRLSAPHNDVVLDSIQALSLDELTVMAHHPTSSRVLDAVLDSPTVPFKAKRKFVMAFISHYHILVDDRIGSRVGDRCWASADPYLKEKIARSLIPHEHALAGSFYGKFFARNLSLHVLQRDPERWKSMQVTAKSQTPAAGPAAAHTSTKPSHINGAEKTPTKADKSKRRAQPRDEIDALFDATLGKKVKKAELVGSAGGESESKDKAQTESKSKSNERAGGDKDREEEKKERKRKNREESAADRDLIDVLGAIRSAPKEGKAPKRKRAY
ncbi:ARM repeat-containing protein [Daedaleopsis nitida]|nr:ARM repeat-containing protein [Daedaleopsis nitida]